MPGSTTSTISESRTGSPNRDAINSLAKISGNGNEGIRLTQQAAQMGHGEALMRLARLYELGYTYHIGPDEVQVKPDMDRALLYAKRAVLEGGNLAATTTLIRLLIFRRDHRRAFVLLSLLRHGMTITGIEAMMKEESSSPQEETEGKDSKDGKAKKRGRYGGSPVPGHSALSAVSLLPDCSMWIPSSVFESCRITKPMIGLIYFYLGEFYCRAWDPIANDNLDERGPFFRQCYQEASLRGVDSALRRYVREAIRMTTYDPRDKEMRERVRERAFDLMIARIAQQGHKEEDASAFSMSAVRGVSDQPVLTSASGLNKSGHANGHTQPYQFARTLYTGRFASAVCQPHEAVYAVARLGSCE